MGLGLDGEGWVVVGVEGGEDSGWGGSNSGVGRGGGEGPLVIHKADEAERRTEGLGLKKGEVLGHEEGGE